MHPILCQYAGFTLWTYGVVLAFGVFCVLLWARAEAGRRNLDTGYLFCGLCLALLAAGGLGGKLGYALSRRLGSPEGLEGVSVLSRGGFSVFGAGAAALATFFAFMRLARQAWASWLDVFATCIPLLETFVRLGCLAVGCCYGRAVSSGPGLVFTDPHAFAPLHVALFPTQPLAAGLGLLSFLLLWRIGKRPLEPGVLMGLSLLLYGASRGIVGHFRGDAVATLGGVKALHLEVGAAAAAALCVLLAARMRRAEGGRT